MAKQDSEKQLEKMDPEPAPAPAPTPGSGDQWLEVVKMLVASNQLTAERLAEMIPQAVSEATMKTRQWWNEAEFPNISHLNPKGEKDHPRPEFTRNVFWLGYLCQKQDHTAAEIELINQIQPGKYHMHSALGEIERRDFFVVAEKTPGVPNGDLLVLYPCADVNDRIALERYNRGRGMVDLLLELVPQAATVAA